MSTGHYCHSSQRIKWRFRREGARPHGGRRCPHAGIGGICPTSGAAASWAAAPCGLGEGKNVVWGGRPQSYNSIEIGLKNCIFRSRFYFCDGLKNWVKLLWNYCVSEAFFSINVQPCGNPINHSAYSGFGIPPSSSSMFQRCFNFVSLPAFNPATPYFWPLPQKISVATCKPLFFHTEPLTPHLPASVSAPNAPC